MSEYEINWCTCKGHNTADWTAVADYYAKHFIPEHWAFDYHKLTCHEGERVLYILGRCDRCGGFMRSGTSVPMNIKDDELLAYVYREMEHYLTDYRFDLVPHLSFGCEGIFLSLCLEGSFNSSDKKKTTIGTFKTLRDDQEACRLMGALGGALMYYGHKYVNQEIRRYTPGSELECMVEQK